MYSTKSEGPRRGRSFDSINLGLTLEEKQLNNEVSTFFPIISIILNGKSCKCFTSVVDLHTCFFIIFHNCYSGEN